jgi:hypothetical protein
LAIYSCNLRSIGKTTHAAGTAGAHLLYIGRPDAAPVLQAGHMPESASEAATWMDRQERADRANARLLDKVRIALPRELSKAERAELVRAFAEDLTGGRVPWFAAIHQEGTDADNPHCHLVVRDRDVTTGRRALFLSDSAREREAKGLTPKAVDWVRDRWEQVCNAALERAGHEARIDRRSLEAQGIDRAPTIHIGPRAAHIEAAVERPHSRDLPENAWWRKAYRDKKPYVTIDQGRTRLERQAEIIDLNLERAARSADRETATWARFEKEQRRLDRQLAERLRVEAQARTKEVRALHQEFGSCLRDLRAQERGESRQAAKTLRETQSPALASLRARQAAERQQLKDRHSSLWQKILLKVDFTGRTGKKQDAARRALARDHKDERGTLASKCRAERLLLQSEVKRRFAELKRQVAGERRAELQALAGRQAAAKARADQLRQTREADREHARIHCEQVLARSKAEAARTTGRSPALRARSRGPELGR